MAKQSELGNSGLGAVGITAVLGSVARSLTAAGTTQADALALGSANNFLGTVAASTGVVLPPGGQGDEIFIYNGGANAVLVYPPVGAAINNLAANASLSLATLKSGIYRYATATAIASCLSG